MKPVENDSLKNSSQETETAEILASFVNLLSASELSSKLRSLDTNALNESERLISTGVLPGFELDVAAAVMNENADSQYTEQETLAQSDEQLPVEFVSFTEESDAVHAVPVSDGNSSGLVGELRQRANILTEACRQPFNEVLRIPYHQPHPDGSPLSEVEILDNLVCEFLNAPDQTMRSNSLNDIRARYLHHDDQTALSRLEQLFTLDAMIRLGEACQQIDNANGQDLTDLRDEQLSALRDLALVSSSPSTTNDRWQAIRNFIDSHPAIPAEVQSNANLVVRSGNIGDTIINYLQSTDRNRQANLSRLTDFIAFRQSEDRPQCEEVARWSSLLHFARDVGEGSIDAAGLQNGISYLQEVSQRAGTGSDKQLAQRLLNAIGPQLIDQVGGLSACSAEEQQQITNQIAQRLSPVLVDSVSVNLPEALLQLVGRDNPALVELAQEEARALQD
jgi:hypothetical protein